MNLSRLTRLLVLMAVFAAGPVRAEPAALDLTHYRGKVVLVDFWASWCGPCKQAFPFMAGLSQRYDAQDLVVITVNTERQRAPGEAFLRQMQSHLPVIWDNDGTLAKAWAVNELPVTLLFDRKGTMRWRHQGFETANSGETLAQLAALIKRR